MTATLLRRLPLLVLGMGAASTFMANVVARRIMSDDQFASWAYLTSLVALFFSFSLLGSEQLILRSSKVYGDRLILSSETVRAVLGAFVAFLLAYILLLDGRIFDFQLGLWAVPILGAIGVIQVAYQIERTRGRLLPAQAALNAWKIALVPAVGLAMWFGVLNAAAVSMGAALLLGAVLAASAIVRARDALEVGAFRTDAAHAFLPFALSLGTLALLNIVDRVLIERVHEARVFASYFYTYTVLVTPFALLANYLGFAEAVGYKHLYSRRGAIRDAMRIAAGTGVITVGWCAVCFLFRDVLRLAFEPTLWSCLALIAVLRCVYSVGSAAMGVHGSPKSIAMANIYTLGGIGIVVVFVQMTAPMLTSILILYSGAWLWRVIVFFLLLPEAARVPNSSLEIGLR